MLDELKSHQLSSAEKAKMHAVADTGVRRKRREESNVAGGPWTYECQW